MKTIEELWKKLENIELVQVRPVEMEELYKRCFEFESPLIVELGSAHGASSIIFAEAAAELGGHLICIDSFPEHYYNQDKFGKYARTKFIKNLAPYNNADVYTLLERDSGELETIEQLKLELYDWGGRQQIDVLFVDADHDYTAVKRDCSLYLPLVRTGGYIGFHDYNNVAFGVKPAVDEAQGIEKIASIWDLAVYKKL